MRQQFAFASRDSPAWVRALAASASSARTVFLVVAPSFALAAGATAALLPLPESRSEFTSLVLLGFPVAFVALTLLGLLAVVALFRAASRLPGVVVEEPDEPVLVPVLRALRDHEVPESGALLARLLRESATATECVRTGRSTSGRLLPDLAVLLTRSPREDLGFPLEVTRALTVLPLDTEWLPGGRRPIEELRERRGALSLLLRDVADGVPSEWALRRFVTGWTET